MEAHELGVDDLGLVETALAHFPEADTLLRALAYIERRASFPISSFDELAESMGGDDAEIGIRDRAYNVGMFRSIIPAFYFPIMSRADLVAKLVELRRTTAPGAQRTFVSGAPPAPPLAPP